MWVVELNNHMFNIMKRLTVKMSDNSKMYYEWWITGRVRINFLMYFIYFIVHFLNFFYFHGTETMLRLSLWISGMVLSGLRHTANLCRKQNDRMIFKVIAKDYTYIYTYDTSLYFSFFFSIFFFSDLFERSRSPHQLVDHVDGDPHEGWKANEVSNCDAPVWVLVVKQCKLRRLEEGAHYDILRRVGGRKELKYDECILI